MSTHEQYRQLMRQVFDELREGIRETTSPHEYDELRESFAFHMTDWADDIQKLSKLRASSDSIRPEDAAKEVVGLLYHLIPHLNEAGNLLLDGVGNQIEPTQAVDSSDRTVKT